MRSASRAASSERSSGSVAPSEPRARVVPRGERIQVTPDGAPPVAGHWCRRPEPKSPATGRAASTSPSRLGVQAGSGQRLRYRCRSGPRCGPHCRNACAYCSQMHQVLIGMRSRQIRSISDDVLLVGTASSKTHHANGLNQIVVVTTLPARLNMRTGLPFFITTDSWRENLHVRRLVRASAHITIARPI